MGTLDGKVAVVTGGYTGIGKAITRAFAAEGCSVVIAARNRERLDEAVEEMKELAGEVVPWPTDVTDEGSVENLFDETIRRFKRIDILVNNAGISEGGRIDEVTLEGFVKVIQINLVGPFLCARAAFRVMKRQNGGRIINIGSIAANRAREHSSSYTASKHGLWGLTQSISLDGREFGISCGQLNPGNTWVERRLASGGNPTSGRGQGVEPFIPSDCMANAALYMALLPSEANALEMTVLPTAQLYVGRG